MRRQIIFNFDTVASFLSMFYYYIKSYRVASFAYRLNFNSMPALLNHFNPMSLLERASSEIVATVVQSIQNKALDRLSLATPSHETLSHYEANLLQDVVALQAGLLTMSMHLISRQTVMSLHEAFPIPMTQADAEDAMIWDQEGENLYFSENDRETALISRLDLTLCIGSFRYSTCYHGFQWKDYGPPVYRFCFVANPVQSMKICDPKLYTLPVSERAINWNIGIWLILSDSELRESHLNDTSHTGTEV